MSPGTESEKETSMGTRSERQPSAEERAAAEIVKLLEFHDLDEREAYCALIQAGVDYRGVQMLTAGLSDLVRIVRTGEL